MEKNSELVGTCLQEIGLQALSSYQKISYYRGYGGFIKKKPFLKLACQN
jgi:hypothetical protein